MDLLEIRELSKSYNKKLALDNLSFSVKASEIFSIVGLNGSGKTTTFRLLLQLLEPDSGMITFEGKKINEIDRNLFGYLPEERSLYRDISIKKQLEFIGGLKGMNQKQIDESIKKLVELLEFNYDLNKTIKQLSKGNQQKVQLMASLLHDPLIIILDEPFSGMDPYNVELMKKLFLKLQKEGKYILLSTHRLDHVESFCTSILVLKHGKTVLKGKVDDIRKSSNEMLITVIDDIPLFKIKDMVKDECVVREGKQIKIYCHDENNAYKYISTLIKKFKVLSVTYSYLTLEDIFMRNKYE